VTVTQDTELAEIVQTMEARNVKRLPVVDGERVVGMITYATSSAPWRPRFDVVGADA